MSTSYPDSRGILATIAHRAMLDYGLFPDFSPEAQAQANAAAAAPQDPAARDLRAMDWVSIDNDDSRDLDQLSVAETLKDESWRLLVAIADVDATVHKASPIDDHARHNTTSVYTAGGIFPMLPERLSTDLTSLAPNEMRAAVITEMTIGADGSIISSDIYRATVTNKAKLAYDSVASWLEGKGAAPTALTTKALQDQVRLQDGISQLLGRARHAQGALTLETIETSAVFEGEVLRDLVPKHTNRAHDLIENLMVAANGVAARWLKDKGLPSIRRVLRTPEHWDRIVALAAQHDGQLPAAADAGALNAFLAKARVARPEQFPDLSLAVIKLLGRGEYALDLPGETVPGHFGLAVSDYMHSTAPNRRFPDVIVQRLIKSGLSSLPPPYTSTELRELATQCTTQEDAAAKVERRVSKSAAALLLHSRIGQTFDAIVTGAAAKGTWARVTTPPVEGRIVQGFEGLKVGQSVRVRLLNSDVARGFIDFAGEK